MRLGWVYLSCEIQVEPQPRKQESVGNDMGLTTFATLSTGEGIENPRFFKKGQQKLAKAQRKFSKHEKGTAERRKQGKIVAKVHEKITNQRKGFGHKEAKSINDASWNQFLQILSYKAVEAGRVLILVDPAYNITRLL